jgi:hypothetical protein
LQAVTEGYKDEYYAAEKEGAQATTAQRDAKDDLSPFNMVTSDYQKDLKHQQKSNTLSNAD